MKALITLILTALVSLTVAIHSSSGSNRNQIQINGGIGDGYIYHAKPSSGQRSHGGPPRGPPHKRHRGPPPSHGRRSAGPRPSIQTIKIIHQQAPPESGSQYGSGGTGQQQQVKTFKVITQSAPPHGPPNGGHSPSVKTIKIIHLQGNSASCGATPQGGGGKGWQ